MNRNKITPAHIAAGIAATACTLLAMSGGIASASASPPNVTERSSQAAGSPGWRLYKVPVTGPAVPITVIAPGRDDAWAAGTTLTAQGAPAPAPAPSASVTGGTVRQAATTSCADAGSLGSLMLSWHGTSWYRVKVPDLGRINYLSATGPADIWASADCGLLHWNGRSWAQVTLPQHQSNLGTFPWPVAAYRPDDAWLAGTTYNSVTSQASGFVDHWNGRAWQKISLPALSMDYSLTGIAVTGPSSVWIAGTDYTGDDVSPARPEGLILLHWNGRSWTRTPAPVTGMWTQRVTGLTAISPTNVWMTGWGKVAPAGNQTRHPLALHWDGHRWSNTLMPAGSGELYQIARAGTQLWAVGDEFGPTQSSAGILRWTGSRWVHAAVPVQGNQGSLAAVAARPGGGLWTVGNLGPTPVIALRSRN